MAGAGKTTALSAVRAAFEADGWAVVGTSTSGQAARTLGREAGIPTSRTLASLLWRLDHGTVRLDERTVVVLDEAAMTDDPGLLRLLAATDAARSKLVMVGDDRQLGAVGPGGALGALLARHPDAVHRLATNLRQADPGERHALAELRSGDLSAAVEWYRANGRIAAHPDHHAALGAMVNAWAADVAEGGDAAMYAWRRANVAELNRRARLAMAEAGRLWGPELMVAERRYQTGDWIVTLAPGADGALVTSETGRVVAVDPVARTLIAGMDDGRAQPFGPDDTATDRLAHGLRGHGPSQSGIDRGGRPPPRRRRRPGAGLCVDEPGPATLDRACRGRRRHRSRRPPPAVGV